jgi:hypothetical protein
VRLVLKTVNLLSILCVSILVCLSLCAIPPVQASIWAPFHTKTEMNNMFKSLCERHPAQASYVSIGKSVLEWDIWLFRFGNSSGSTVLWDGQMHGNEDYGSEILWLIAQWLFSGDSRAQRILENNYILMVPVVNIDVWGRYNARDVNLNRNFETGWNKGAEHPGSSPFSEPETQALRKVFTDYKPDFYVNLHQGSNGYFSYYSGSNLTVASQVTNRARQIANELGVNPYRVHSMGSSGYAIGDAYSLANASSWLAEVDPKWIHTDVEWNRIVDEMYPKCLAMFIAMCEVFTPVPQPSPSPQPQPSPSPQERKSETSNVKSSPIVPTKITLSTSESICYTGQKIEFQGSLTSEIGNLYGNTILISCSNNEGSTWNNITSAMMTSNGTYSASWTPDNTGSYIVKASWQGNKSFSGANATYKLTVLSKREQDGFIVISNSSILALAFNPETKELKFSLSCEEDTVGYFNATIPKNLLAGNPWRVKIDNELASFQLSENATHIIISASYSFSNTLQVAIVGTWTATEFSSPLLAYIIAGALLFAAVMFLLFRKRLRSSSFYSRLSSKKTKSSKLSANQRNIKSFRELLRNKNYPIYLTNTFLRFSLNSVSALPRR